MTLDPRDLRPDWTDTVRIVVMGILALTIVVILVGAPS